MAKQLPYFKFFVSEWSDGDITIEDYNIQGLFINICSYYWSKECVLSSKVLYKRFKHSKDQIDYLISEGHLKLLKGFIRINFLDEQQDDRSKAKINQRKGGLASAEKRRLNKIKQDDQAQLESSTSEIEQSFNDIEKMWYDWFLESWNASYLHYKKKTVSMKRLTKSSEDSLKSIVNTFGKEATKQAMVGLMMQKSFPNDSDLINLTHFLKDEGMFIEKYLIAYQTGNKEIYKSIKKFE